MLSVPFHRSEKTLNNLSFLSAAQHVMSLKWMGISCDRFFCYMDIPSSYMLALPDSLEIKFTDHSYFSGVLNLDASGGIVSQR